MSPDWLTALGTIGGTTALIASILIPLHRSTVERDRKWRKNVKKRLDHLDDCLDRLRGQLYTRRTTDAVPTAQPTNKGV